MSKFDDCGLREQAQALLDYIEQDPKQTLIPDGRVRLLKQTLSYPEPEETPKLGLATTGELLAELTARAEVHGYAKYRTVGGEEIMDVVPSIEPERFKRVSPESCPY